MKIWKSKDDGKVSQDSNPVFDYTGVAGDEPQSEKVQSLTLEKPTVFFLDGKETLDPHDGMSEEVAESAGKAVRNGFKYANTIGTMHMGDAANDADIYMVAYTDNTLNPIPEKEDSEIVSSEGARESQTLYRGILDDETRYPGDCGVRSMANRHDPENFYSYDAKMFVEQMLMPAITDENGEFLPKDEVKQKLDNLTLVGYSYGNVLCKEIEHCLRDKMIEKDVDAGEMKDMLRHVMVLAPGTAVQLRGDNLFSSVNFEGRNDAWRRFMQSSDSEEVRGISLEKDPREVLDGISLERTKDHKWKGLEVRTKLGDQSLENAATVLFDSVEKVNIKHSPSLDGVFDEDVKVAKEANRALAEAGSDEEAVQACKDALKKDLLPVANWRYHLPGGVFSSPDPEGQCVPLVFNRVLNNAVERGAHRGGVDMDGESQIHEMFTKIPANEMTPDSLRDDFKRRLSYALDVGAMKPFTESVMPIESMSQRKLEEAAWQGV